MAEYPHLALPDTTVADALQTCIDALRAGQQHMALPSRRRMLETAARQAEQALGRARYQGHRVSTDMHLPAPGQWCETCHQPGHLVCYVVDSVDRAAPLVEMHNAAIRVQTPSLTPRERECLDRIAQGFTDVEIARQLYLGANTVKSHLKTLYVKLGARNRAHAVSLAWQCGLLTVGHLDAA